MEVSVVGLGCWGIGGPMERDGTISGYGEVDDAESSRMLAHALDQGVNFLDTAPWYGNGHSEHLVGQVIRNRREEVVVSTKVGIFLEEKRYTSDYSGDYIMAHYEDSLERLGTDYIDVYVLHSPEAGLYDPSGMAALKELKRRGVIRSYGISFPASHAESESFFLPLCEEQEVEVVQLRFNLAELERPGADPSAAPAAGRGRRLPRALLLRLPDRAIHPGHGFSIPPRTFDPPGPGRDTCRWSKPRNDSISSTGDWAALRPGPHWATASPKSRSRPPFPGP